MICRFKQLFCGHAREAWSHSNLVPIEPVVRINWHLYEKVMEARAQLTQKQMHDMRFNQVVRQKVEGLTNITGVFNHE